MHYPPHGRAHEVIPPELLVSWAAMIGAAIWIGHLQRRIYRMEEVYDEAEDALEAADEAVTRYQTILVDVALKHATLEITADGSIITTRTADREASRH